MNLISYILKVHLVFTILFVLYHVFFRREKFLALNRLVLISIIAAAFVLPVSPALNMMGFDTDQQEPQLTVVNTFPRFIVNNQSGNGLKHISGGVQVDWFKQAITVYILVAAFLLAILLINLFKIYVVIRRSRQYKAGGITYCEPTYDTPPFSFFNFIVVSKNAFHPEEYNQIITHETAHCSQLHSLDVLLADIACILLWINPLIYLYRRQVRLNLEFLADEAVLSSGINGHNYQLSLLQNSGILKAHLPVNAFFTSKIKERIVMMNTGRPNTSSTYKYLLLPVVLLALSVVVGFKKDRTVFIDKTALSLKPPTEKNNSPVVSNKLQVFFKSPKRGKHLAEFTKLKQYDSVITIDARTDTVKFSLVPDSLGRKFIGIYVVENNVLTDDELRTAIKPTGRLQMILASRPIVGMYTPNDSTAVRRWGEQARLGVVFVKARTVKPNR